MGKEESVYLDEPFSHLENNGIDTAKIKVVDEKSGETINFKNGSRITTVPTSSKTVRSKGYYYSQSYN